MGLEIPAQFTDPKYRLRRFQNWMVVGLLYALFYMSRYNLSTAAPELMKVFGWTKNDYGIFETVMPLIYGLSVFFNGPIADRVGGKKAFLFGAFGVVIMNALFGLSHLLVQSPAVWTAATATTQATLMQPAQFSHGLTGSSLLTILAIIWGLNGYFQSFGALSIVKINAQWFHVRERGTFAAIFGILIRFGLILAFSGVPLIVKASSWYQAFMIPAILVAIWFVACLLLVKDTPEQAGFPAMDTGDDSGDSEERVPTMVVLKKVFASSAMWIIGVGSMMIGLVRRSVVDAWWPVYFKEVHHVGGLSAVYQSTAWGIALAGIGGGFAFGISSDRVYKGRRAPVIVFGFIGMALALGFFYLSDVMGLGPWLAALSLMALSFFVNGTHGMVGGAATMDFGGRKAAATAAGLIDGMQYLAASTTGITVGFITKNYGWGLWKLWPIPFAIFGAVVMLKLWNVMPGKKGSH
ncbi:MAG: MFS transporter [Deltaproteobacteria bacterium]|nr:MFS transporter [Deltaproteobacteria bacterium]